MRVPILDRLEFLAPGEVLIADGATGTMLQAAGLPTGHARRGLDPGAARGDHGAAPGLSGRRLSAHPHQYLWRHAVPA